MTSTKYPDLTLEQKLAHLVEECGEVLQAVGKTQRWGLYSVNPELPPDKQEINKDWILRELADLRETIDRVELALLMDGSQYRNSPR